MTSTPVGKMFFHILGAVAEFEAALASERTMDGLAAARARGRTGGQKAKLGPRQVKLAWQMYDEKDATGKRKYTVQQIADEFGVTRPHHLPPLGQSDPVVTRPNCLIPLYMTPGRSFGSSRP